jgi:branched-chain amino acid transport system permease protein
MTLISRQRPALALVAVMAVVTVLIQGHPVWLDTSVTIAIYGLIALSVGITWGQAGILSVAQAAFAALGAYATAIVTVQWGWSPYEGLAAALVLPALVAYPLAYVVTRLAPLALAIATLAFGEVFYMAVREGGDFTGGFIGLSGVPSIDIASTPLEFHLLAWGAVLLVVVLYANLAASRTGAALRTIRHDRQRAIADGIDVSRSLSGVFALSASIAGLAGWLYAHYITYLAPESLATTLSISVLLMAIVGGAATVLGPVLGAALLTLAYQVLPAAETQGMFYGGAVIVAIVLAPRGLLGLDPRGLVRRLRPGAPGAAAAADDARHAQESAERHQIVSNTGV